jgi:amino acid transporter
MSGPVQKETWRVYLMNIDRRSMAGAGEVFVIIMLFSFGLQAGGPVAMVFGWLIMSVMTLIVIINLTELSSAYPNAGSVYNWVGNLVSKPWSPFVSYITAVWLILAYVATTAKIAISIAFLINYALDLGGYTLLTNTYLVLMAETILTVWLVSNTMRMETTLIG